MGFCKEWHWLVLRLLLQSDRNVLLCSEYLLEMSLVESLLTHIRGQPDGLRRREGSELLVALAWKEGLCLWLSSLLG